MFINIDVAWAGMIGAISGAAIVGTLALVNNWVQFQRDRNLKRAALKREKVEVLYAALERTKYAFTSSILVNADRLYQAPKSVTEKYESKGSDLNKDIGEVKMLINLYVPELSGLYQKLETEWTDYNTIIVTSLKPEAYVDPFLTLEKLNISLQKACVVCTALQEELANIVKRNR